jgi:hypothetical protein
MIRATLNQFPLLVFSLIVILCITFDEYRVLLLLTTVSCIFWLIYAQVHTTFSYKNIFKSKKH